MNVSEIPLTPNNQTFAITLAGVAYQMRIVWRDAFWSLDLMDSAGTLMVGSVPLLSGSDLLAQHAYLNLDFSLDVVCDRGGSENPTRTDLGVRSHLYVVTE